MDIKIESLKCTTCGHQAAKALALTDGSETRIVCPVCYLSPGKAQTPAAFSCAGGGVIIPEFTSSEESGPVGKVTMIRVGHEEETKRIP